MYCAPVYPWLWSDAVATSPTRTAASLLQVPEIRHEIMRRERYERRPVSVCGVFNFPAAFGFRCYRGLHSENPCRGFTDDCHLRLFCTIYLRTAIT